MECDRKGCEKAATQQAVIILRVDFGEACARSEPLVYVCDDHAKDATWDDLVGDKNWLIISATFARKGLARPKRECSYIKLEPIAEVRHDRSTA